MDSPGVKIYGEGEWKIRKHGQPKRRTWLAESTLSDKF